MSRDRKIRVCLVRSDRGGSKKTGELVSSGDCGGGTFDKSLLDVANREVGLVQVRQDLVAPSYLPSRKNCSGVLSYDLMMFGDGD